MSDRKSRRAIVLSLLGERLTCELHALWWAWRIPRAVTSPKIHERALIEAFLRPGDVALDVGANSGCWSHTMAKRVGPSGIVHAFEIYPYFARAASRAMQICGIRNAVVHAIGLGATESEVSIVIRDESGEMLSGRIHIASDEESPQEIQRVNIRTLDGFAKEHAELSRTRFMKVDIEGAELDLFQGVRQFLTTVHPVIYCEIVDKFCQRNGHRAAHVFELIKGYDYDIWSMDADGTRRPLVEFMQTGGANYLLTPH